MTYAPKLSIIIPFFNVEQYLPQCLESVFNQNISPNDYEVICVDDCSEDTCKNIVRSYQRAHFNLILEEHNTNQMLGAARNTGINKARGKYIWCIDSDDCIKPNILQELLDLLEENDLDVLCFEYSQNIQIILKENTANILSHKTTGLDFLESNYDKFLGLLTAWSKIIRLDLIKRHNCFFAEGVYFEDGDNILKLLYNAEKTMYMYYPIYYYRIHNQSIMNDSTSGKKYADMVKMGARKLLFSEQIKEESPSIALKIRQDALWNATTVKRIIFLTHLERSIFYKELNFIQYDSIKEDHNSIYVHFLFLHPTIVNAFLFFISPILRLLKQLKNEIHRHNRRSR